MLRERAKTAADSRGFTLIEILIALVVLAIGIYGMLRVFPVGFSAIEASQQRTTAAQLGDAELARWRLDPEALPDAVVATDYVGKLIPATLTNSIENLRGMLVYGGQGAYTPGSESYQAMVLSSQQLANLDRVGRVLIYSPVDLTPSQFDGVQQPLVAGHQLRPAALHPNWEPNSLYLPRTIVGERIDLRSLPQTRPGVPFYLLSHAPCDALRYEQRATGPLGEQVAQVSVYFDIYDARPWRNVYGGKAKDQLAEREFTFESGALWFGPSEVAKQPDRARSFLVNYTARFERVLGFTVNVGARPNAAGPGDPPLGVDVDPSTIQVYERMVALTDAEYLDLVDRPLAWPRNAYYVNAESTVSGLIQFSPVLQSDPLPTDITVAKVDYRVADWQVLVFDVEVPSVPVETPVERTPPAQLDAMARVYVQLPVRNLKSAGYTNPPRQGRSQEIAVGARRFYDWSGNRVEPGERDTPDWGRKTAAYVVAVDRQSGEILTDNELAETGGWPANPWMRRSRFNVDYKEGLLYFNYNPQRVYRFDANVDTPNRGGRTYRIFCRAQNDWAVQLSIAARQYARSASGKPGGLPATFTATGGAIVATYGWRTDERRQVFFPLSEAGQTVAIDYYTSVRDPATNTERLAFVEGEVHTIGGPNVTSLGEWVCPLSDVLAHEPNHWGPTAVRGLTVRARTTWVTPGRSTTLQELVSSLRERRLARPSLQEAWHQVIVSTILTRAAI